MNRNRKVPENVLAVFSKYQANNVRQLKKDEALEMLKAEFGLDNEQAENIFYTFDKNNDNIMSIWEFKMFFDCAGDHAQEIVQKFRELDADGSGKLDVEEARLGLKTLKTATGRVLEDKEIEFFIQTTGTDDNTIDLGHFVNLLHRLKLYNAPPPPANVKIHA
ncbi:mitochondrial substrate carrier family protein C-like [Haliotis rufescens]|uniref:mitochondrial substrate carrier family protein C-like n=1 Tax=Haliotis rufescens TaxID=6454 RepID=UPI001EB02C68|nr:mitochondrial substrate carrier family protein C-like [Haliotis rufescens]XP_048238098.1 mitochondrial substrate carrier family protein C-like [Haliotis rufescens]